MPRAFRQTISPLLALLCGILKPGFGSIHATNPLRSQTARSCPCLRPSTTPLKRLIQGLMQIISGEGHLVIGYCAFSILCAGCSLADHWRCPLETATAPRRLKTWRTEPGPGIVHLSTRPPGCGSPDGTPAGRGVVGAVDRLINFSTSTQTAPSWLAPIFSPVQPLPYGIGMPASRANWTSSGSCHPVRT